MKRNWDEDSINIINNNNKVCAIYVLLRELGVGVGVGEGGSCQRSYEIEESVRSTKKKKHSHN